jgi:hypothetical protein
VDLTAVINQLIAGGRNVGPEDVATLSPLITHIIRFGDWHLDLTPPETAGDGRLALPGDQRWPRPTSPVAEADYRQQPGTGNRDQ